MDISYFNADRQPSHQYMDLVREILQNGERKVAQNKAGRSDSFAIHGTMMKYDLRNGFPAMTERKFQPMGAIKELIWMLSGSTNVEDLRALKCHFWDAWGKLEFTSQFGRQENDLGPLYGHQWRNFNGSFDQISWLVENIKRDPDGKAHRVIAWNPSEFLNLDGSFNVRPLTCHGDFQVSHSNGYLDMCVTQRSGDVLIGVPFNIVFYSALLIMLAQVCGLKPRWLTHYINDAHIYETQLLETDEESGTLKIHLLLAREPRPYPTITVDPDIKDIFGFKPEHFKIEGYDPHPPIKFAVEV